MCKERGHCLQASRPDLCEVFVLCGKSSRQLCPAVSRTQDQHDHDHFSNVQVTHSKVEMWAFRSPWLCGCPRILPNFYQTSDLKFPELPNAVLSGVGNSAELVGLCQVSLTHRCPKGMPLRDGMTCRLRKYVHFFHLESLKYSERFLLRTNHNGISKMKF
jgi:hypothetical protein